MSMIDSKGVAIFFYAYYQVIAFGEFCRQSVAVKRPILTSACLCSIVNVMIMLEFFVLSHRRSSYMFIVFDAATSQSD